jgi:hypothetical protein
MGEMLGKFIHSEGVGLCWINYLAQLLPQTVPTYSQCMLHLHRVLIALHGSDLAQPSLSRLVIEVYRLD